MTHPLIPLIATQPHLVVDHVQAYVALVTDEFSEVMVAWKRRVLLNTIALCSLGVAGVLTGVASMMWAYLPSPGAQTPWALVIAPLVPAVIALGCWLGARRAARAAAFEKTRGQIRADLAMLRDVSA